MEACRLDAAEIVDVVTENNSLVAELYKNNARAKAALSSSFDGIELDKLGVRTQGFDIYPGILRCRASKSMYQIKWDGKMYPCVSFLSPYTFPLEEGFKEAWDRLPGLLKDLRRPKKCFTCGYFDRCIICPARAQAETGSFDEAPENICDFVKEMAARNMI